MRTSDPLTTEIYKGHVIAIYPDEGPHECPLDWDQTREGQKHNTKKPTDEITPGVYFITFERNSTLAWMHHFDKPGEVLPWAAEHDYFPFPLYKYEHGSVAYSTGSFSCPWDSGQVGFVLIKNSEFPETSEHGTREERQALLAKCTCEAVTNWCNGNYVGYAVFPKGQGIETTPRGERVNTHDIDLIDAIDSCWGFDCSDAAMSEGKEMVNHTVQEAEALAYRAHCVMCDIPVESDLTST